jgi:hypothetical protein
VTTVLPFRQCGHGCGRRNEGRGWRSNSPCYATPRQKAAQPSQAFYGVGRDRPRRPCADDAARARAAARRMAGCSAVPARDRHGHPALFDLVATRLTSHLTPRLLSFGCSTGEEAFTLAHHLPAATIDAIDANPACIAQARRHADRLHSKWTRFLCADSPDAFAPARYDAVFCLSVLRHGDLESHRPDRCTHLLPFARFAVAVEALDNCLLPGGLLILWGCNFRFTDTVTAARYRTIASPGAKSQPGPFYGANDRLLPDDTYAAFVFVKAGDRSGDMDHE